jgi:ubiquinone biosynthesis protein
MAHETAARRRRERQISEILARNGLEALAAAAGHRGPPEAPQTHRWASLVSPDRLRHALEELGPTFIKLGQILSTRADLLPSDYQLELAKLQDAAPQLPGDVVGELVTVELDGPLDQVFASFELEPIAAGSIGQAHAATLSDGTEVVVKVRRPGIVETVREDLEILRNFAARASRRWNRAESYDLTSIVDEFGEGLLAELDYLQEGRNAERFAANFQGDTDVRIPKVFWEKTTSRVLTLERVYGMKINDLVALESAGIDRHDLASRATRVTAKMIFAHGFFHADPHPGNFFIQPDGTIAMIDFGLVGILGELMRDRLAKVLVAVVRHDPDRLARALLALGASTGPVDRALLRNDLGALLAQLEGRALKDVELGPLISQIMEISRRHHLRLPNDLALLLKTFVMDEGLATQLDPGFKLVEALRPYAYRQLASELSPAELVSRLRHFGADVAELGVDLPKQLHRTLEVLATGGFEIHLRAAELDDVVTRAERLTNKIAVSVIAAALINAVAELVASDRTGLPAKRALILPAATGVAAVIATRERTRRRTRRTRPGTSGPDGARLA